MVRKLEVWEHSDAEKIIIHNRGEKNNDEEV